MTGRKTYDQKYTGEEYYWGTEPSKLSTKVIETIQSRPGTKPKLIDLGSGEGRDIVYFASQGFDVTGVDLSSEGLRKTKNLAEEKGIEEAADSIAKVATTELDITEIKASYPVFNFSGDDRNVVVKVSFTLSDSQGIVRSGTNYYEYEHHPLVNTWHREYDSSKFSYYMNFLF